MIRAFRLPPRPPLLLALALPWLSACGHPSPQAAAAAEDVQCRSYGFRPGEVLYTQCRSTLERRRAILASRPPGSGDPARLPIYLPPPLMPAPGERGCMTTPVGGELFTNCP